MNLLILVVDDEPDVEVLFRQQFRRDLRAGRFTWVCPIRPWHFSASPMQATVLIPILSTSTCTMFPTRTPVPVSTERGQNRREIGARANGSPGSPANFRPTSWQLKRTQPGATISGKSKKSENGCWSFLFAFRCRGARSEHFCTDSWFQLAKAPRVARRQ